MKIHISEKSNNVIILFIHRKTYFTTNLKLHTDSTDIVIFTIKLKLLNIFTSQLNY